MGINSVLVELIDVCNLNCAYCLRDESALHGKPHAFPIHDLQRILGEVKQLAPSCEVVFTGGEPTLHPDFRLALQTVHDLGWRFVVITNGWAFTRALPAVVEFRESLRAIAFSIDGFTRDSHDHFRGRGSFDRLMRAVLACRSHALPFRFKVTLDREKAAAIGDFARFAARLGADRLEVGPLFPTSSADLAHELRIADHRELLGEVAALRSTLRLPIHLAAGFYDPRPEPGCGPLVGSTINIDYFGRLVLCTNLLGFRGQAESRDVVADLKSVPLTDALALLAKTVAGQNQKRHQAFLALGHNRELAPLELGSACLDCLCSFGKTQREPFDFSHGKKPMNDTLAFEIPDSIIASELDGREALLLDTFKLKYHTLNETAAFLWSGIEKGQTVAAMTQALLEAFDVDEVRARASVTSALGHLEDQGLVRRAAPAPAGNDARRLPGV